MNQGQENIVSMWNVTDEVLTGANATWTANAAFNRRVNIFRTAKQEISPYRQTQATVITGIRLDKIADRNLAAGHAAIIAANLRALAQDNEDHELEAKVTFSAAELKKMPDTDLSEKLIALYYIADDFRADLGGYGTTSQHIDDLLTYTQAFSGLSSKPRQAQTDKTVATLRIAELIKKGQSALQKVDDMIVNFKTAAPDFVAQYFEARKVMDYGIRHRKPAEQLAEAAGA